MPLGSNLLLGLVLATVSLSTPNPSSDIAHASREQMTDGFLRWADTLPKDQRTIRLGMPAIDVYSRSGTLLYHGQDAAKNAAFLRAFPDSLSGAKPSEQRPPLKTIVEMFPEFMRDEPRLLDGSKYTVVAYTYVGWDVAKPQDDAINDLRKRAAQSSVRVLEVRMPK